MKSSTRTLLIVVGALIVLAAGAAAFVWFSGGSGAPSATISAPTLELASEATTAPTDVPAEATAESDATSATEEAAAPEAASAPVVFNIVADESLVSFALDEDLRGSRVTVVGTTNQVAGQIAVDFATPSASQVGVIRINVRTLATDNEFRDRAIRGQILQSSNDAFEFAQFTPTAVSGLPESVTLGTAFTFQVTGDLQLRDVTQSVTFDVEVTPTSEERIEGTASAVVTREQYGLTIPSVPGVANVEEEVELTIEFVATTG